MQKEEMRLQAGTSPAWSNVLAKPVYCI